MPAGKVRTGSLLRIASSDSVTPNIQTLLDVPIHTGPTVYLRDLGTVYSGSPGQDIADQNSRVPRQPERRGERRSDGLEASTDHWAIHWPFARNCS
jgi:hypothetical protein